MTRARSDRSANKTARWIVIVVAVIALLGTAWFLGVWYEAREDPTQAGAAWRGQEGQPDAEPEQGVPGESGQQLPTPIPVPRQVLALDESDEPLQEQVLAASNHPAFPGWLSGDDLARHAVASIDNVADGVSPRRHLGFLAPAGGYLVLGDPMSEGDLRTDPAGYRRYDLVAEVVASIDPDVVARLYVEFGPTLERAYAELGRNDETLDQRVRAAIYELLATPTPSTESPELIAVEGAYEYRDAELELSSDAQKHLLRMGPGNASQVRKALRRLARAIGMPDEELPSPDPAPAYPTPASPAVRSR